MLQHNSIECVMKASHSQRSHHPPSAPVGGTMVFGAFTTGTESTAGKCAMQELSLTPQKVRCNSCVGCNRVKPMEGARHRL